MPEKQLGDLTRSSIGWGTFNSDAPGETIKHQKTGLDFTDNRDPGGDEKAFPTASGGLSSNNVGNPLDPTLIKEFRKPNKFGRTNKPELYK